MATLSFHQTKNIASGEAGALLIVDPAPVARPRSSARKERTALSSIAESSTVDIGSSYVPGELIAAFLPAQLESVLPVTVDVSDRLLRLPIWSGMTKDVDFVVGAIGAALGATARGAPSARPVLSVSRCCE